MFQTTNQIIMIIIIHKFNLPIKMDNDDNAEECNPKSGSNWKIAKHDFTTR